jgi:Domain of unknown function (DUF222)
MRIGPGVEQVSTGLDALAAADVVTLDDATLREQLLALATLTNRLRAEVVRRVDVFDRRGLAEPDGFRTTKAWLRAFTRVPPTVANRLVKAARLLRRLPKLAAATQAGDVCPEQVQQVVRLADRVTVEQVAEVEPILADAAAVLDPARFATVCQRVLAHVDPDGPDPGRAFEQRNLSVTAADGMVLVRGQLDPEGGAALTTALDALMTPPGEGDERTAGQRRADALVELARRQLTAGSLPSVGGQRPQIGVLLHPQALSPATLQRLADVHQAEAAGAQLRRFLTEPAPAAETDWTRPGVAVDPDDLPTRAGGRTRQAMLAELLDQPPAEAPAGADPPRAGPAPPPAGTPSWDQAGWADPPWLSWVGPIHPAVAQRIACDADIWRIILDPATGMPLDVGRGYRLVPHWIRRALHARDRGCRWPGCDVPAEWSDAHHRQPWAEGGRTNVTDCILLCRHHHCLVHEGGWTIDLDLRTGKVHITRPEGIPYLVPRASSASWNGPTTQAA